MLLLEAVGPCLSVLGIPPIAGQWTTYPALPTTPMTSLNPRVKHPSLPPEQKQHPDGDQRMREAEQPPHGQVVPDPMQYAEQKFRRHMSTGCLPEPPQRPRSTLGPGQAIVYRRRIGISCRSVVEGRGETVAVVAMAV